MKIPFDVKYRIEHRSGQVQASSLEIWARNSAEARLLAREVIRARCGEPAAYVHAEPQGEGARR
jgi:hypothetical protein